jgi:glucosamine--fructose-6-phosphate aminotransferase (isomerizing)
MCGIIAVLRRPPTRPAPDPDELFAALASALGHLDGDEPDAARIRAAAGALRGVDQQLGGVPGVEALLTFADLAEGIAAQTATVEARIGEIEAALDAGQVEVTEALNAAIIEAKDASWAITRDRLRTAVAVRALAGPYATPRAIAAFTSVQVALSALDRLEVRGRDSAGLHLLVTGATAAAHVTNRGDALFTNGALRALPDGTLSFVYKAAAEIGELGDNSAALRAAITEDTLLHEVLSSSAEVEVVVLGHTRWASVGIISQANAHPLNSEEYEQTGSRPYVVGALNGDVDNYAELTEREGLQIPGEVTTDAKVIPTMVARRLSTGAEAAEAFRATVDAFEGSVAIAACAADAPDTVLLAQRGSGQALYVGLAEDAFVVASEPYGVVEETVDYVRLDGESTTESGSQGQVVFLTRDGAGTLVGMRRLAYDGSELAVTEADVVKAEITTRDIDRAGFPHFLLKEITESPQSFRKTLRGKIVDRNGRLSVSLGDETLPLALRSRLKANEFGRIYVIGQGTAAVAGQSLATALTDALAGSPVRVRALPATELSGFELDDDMTDVLVIAISQSGTTTDTNRTVDLVRSRGGSVIAIVNRRNSDLVDKSDGVLYTSDGRDVEMSVASTKAFYAQIAAGALLALGIGAEAGTGDAAREDELLRALRALPDAMQQVIDRRETIAGAARLAPPRRYWAVVGNGANRIAAAETRIKLSELCYKSIACDATEDKKHIDLSSEPLIFVCAAGLSGANADDVAKEVAIYRAHKAAPIVVTTDGQDRFGAALATIEVPETHPDLAFVLSAMAGHIFGYEAALAIDGQALLLREARAAVEALAGIEDDPDVYLARLRELIQPAATRFFALLRSGELNGHLEASTAERVGSLLRYTAGIVPLEAYQVEYGKVGTPAVLIEDLVAALTSAIEELTRPIDAIKHQAKTVTVGISRSEDVLFRAPLVAEVLAAGAGRDRLSYKALRTLANLGPAVEEVTGYTRYRIDGSTITVLDKGGVAAEIPSRTEANRELRGTKHRAAYEREVTVARGRSDGRTFILVPEVKDNEVTGMTLVHARFADVLDASTARAVLTGYRNRYAALVDAVTETEPVFDDARLADLPFVDLLVEPVYVLADRWRSLA